MIDLDCKLLLCREVLVFTTVFNISKMFLPLLNYSALEASLSACNRTKIRLFEDWKGIQVFTAINDIREAHSFGLVFRAAL